MACEYVMANNIYIGILPEAFVVLESNFLYDKKGHRNNRWPVNHILYLEVNSCMLGLLFLIVIILTRKNCVKNNTNKRANSKT